MTPVLTHPMKSTRPFHPTPVITIDGPTASGKGTVAALVAAHLGFHLLDSGALYRLAALASIRYQVEPDDADALASLVDGLHITFREGCAQLDGVDVSDEIRAEAVGNRASAIAVHASVRAALVAAGAALVGGCTVTPWTDSWQPTHVPSQPAPRAASGGPGGPR